MKKLITLCMSLSLLFGFSPVLVHAVSETKTEEAATTSVTTTAPEDTEAKTKARATRVDAYKKNLKETLTTTVKNRIADRCQAAQTLVKVKTRNNTDITEKRTEKYDGIVAKLESLATRLAGEDADVSALNANIVELKSKITLFTTANESYQDALSDLETVECKTDPTAFKAALEAARAAQVKVHDAAKEIRTYLVGTVKPALQAIKAASESEN